MKKRSYFIFSTIVLLLLVSVFLLKGTIFDHSIDPQEQQQTCEVVRSYLTEMSNISYSEQQPFDKLAAFVEPDQREHVKNEVSWFFQVRLSPEKLSTHGTDSMKVTFQRVDGKRYLVHGDTTFKMIKRDGSAAAPAPISQEFILLKQADGSFKISDVLVSTAASKAKN